MAPRNKNSIGKHVSSGKVRYERDDSASDPYSDELLDEADSPEILDTGDETLAEILAGDESESIGDAKEEELDLEDAEDLSGEDVDTDAINQDEEDEHEADDGAIVQRKIANVSFGALAKAHTALDASSGVNNKRKRGQERSSEAEEKLRALRDRLRELQGTKSATSSGSTSNRKNVTKKSEELISLNVGGSDQEEEDDSDSDTDSDVSEGDLKKGKQQRSSKHAPTIQSSKKAVTRKREVIDTPKIRSRDPRFDPLTGAAPDREKLNKKYAFVAEYQASELSSLKSLLKDRHASRTMTESEREDLKRKIASMESKAKAQQNTDRVREIEREHKKRERDAVGQGKKPFFLKKSEVKKQALVKKFEGMKGRERERAVERRRKKLSQRERRSMPDMRRNA